ncbi:hypothetical protein GGR56DRAFT_646710 [Xylariaceae sp. FL0804]|nr:hypothetical protein GGR56DRAFT_646710 [Xylariaceae sp. FL0804]
MRRRCTRRRRRRIRRPRASSAYSTRMCVHGCSFLLFCLPTFFSFHGYLRPPTPQGITEPFHPRRAGAPFPLFETRCWLPYRTHEVAKELEMRHTDAFVEEHSPPFSVTHLMQSDEAARTASSSNNYLMAAITGSTAPTPVHDVFAHIDDVAKAHLRVAFAEPAADGPRDCAIATGVDIEAIFG